MFLANISWGLMSPVAKIVMAGSIITPLVLCWFRIAGAMTLFWLMSLFQKRERVEPKDLAKLFGASLLAIVFNQCSFIFGVGLTSPADASIITTSMPLWTMILSAFFLSESITTDKVIGLAFGASGALLLIVGSAKFGTGAHADHSNIYGDLLVMSAQISYAFYIVIFKNFVKKYALVTIMKWMFTFSFLCILPFSLKSVIATDWQSVGIHKIEGIAFIVVFATFISYTMVVVGLKHLRPTVTGMYNYIQPVVACIVTIAIGLDSFSWIKAVAITLIFGGVYLVTISKSKTNESTSIEPVIAPEAQVERVKCGSI